MELEITYMSGAGNLFTVIDNRKYGIPSEKAGELAPVLCRYSEYNSFVTEGLLLINSGNNDFEVLFFNPDGSTGMMCGNGARCAVYFAKNEGFLGIDNIEQNIRFSMLYDIYSAQFNNDMIRVFFPPPLEINQNLIIELSGMNIPADYVNVGSDHVVINIKNIYRGKSEDFDLLEFAPNIRYHSDFQPGGANVNIYELKDEYINLRTYERGVEAETGACGTGAISTAIISVLKKETNFPVKIFPTSQSPLIVDVIGEFPNNIKNIILEGKAEVLDKKIIYIPEM